MKTVRLIGILTAASLIVGCTACSGSPSPEEAKSTTTTAVSTTKTEAVTTKASGALNPLTGLDDMKSATSRPVAVMVGNNDKSRPQYGIEKADMLIEGETEGGITRIMAVFSDASRVPDAVGPVRSARSPFVKLAVALDTIYCHCGGSLGGKAELRSSGLAHIDGTSDGSAYWRDDGLRYSKGYEYSMLTSGSKLQSRIKNLGLRTKANNSSPFTFGNKTGDKSATQVQLYLSSTQTISFKYNSKDKLYYKSNGSLENGTKHVTASGTQLTATNVILIYDERYVEESASQTDQGVNVYGYNMSSGSGQIMSGGTVRNIRWSRTDSGLSFTESDGSALTVAKGRTYLCFASTGYKDDMIIR